MEGKFGFCSHTTNKLTLNPKNQKGKKKLVDFFNFRAELERGAFLDTKLIQPHY